MCESRCDKEIQCNSYSVNKSHCFISQCDSPEKVESCTDCYFASKIDLTSAVSCTTKSEQTTSSAMTSPKMSTVTPTANKTTSYSHQTLAQLANSVNITEAYNTGATSRPSDSTTAQQESNRSLTTDSSTAAITTLSNVSLTVSEANTPFPIESNATRPSNNETVSLSNTLATTNENGTTTWTQTIDTKSLTINENVSDPTITQAINAVECVCVCKFTNQSLEDSIKIRKKELAVDKGSLTTAVRKLNSAKDIRKSSKAIGVLSVIVLITCGVLVICPDVFTCLNFLYKSILKKKKNKKRQVDHFRV